MLSGIGDCGHLNQIGIQCRVSLPSVGKNLQEHLGSAAHSFLVDQGTGLVSSRYLTPRTINEWVVDKSGPLTSVGGVDSLGFINTKYNRKEKDFPDVQIEFAPVGAERLAFVRNRGLKRDVYN